MPAATITMAIMKWSN